MVQWFLLSRTRDGLKQLSQLVSTSVTVQRPTQLGFSLQLHLNELITAQLCLIIWELVASSLVIVIFPEISQHYKLPVRRIQYFRLSDTQSSPYTNRPVGHSCLQAGVETPDKGQGCQAPSGFKDPLACWYCSSHIFSLEKMFKNLILADYEQDLELHPRYCSCFCFF